MTSDPFVRKIQRSVTVDSVTGGWWPQSRELAAGSQSTRALSVRSRWTRDHGVRSR